MAGACLTAVHSHYLSDCYVTKKTDLQQCNMVWEIMFKQRSDSDHCKWSSRQSTAEQSTDSNLSLLHKLSKVVFEDGKWEVHPKKAFADS